MVVTRYVLLGCLVVMIAGCGSKPKDLIVGKWKTSRKMGDKTFESTMEFTSDGKVKSSVEGKIVVEGKYKFLDDSNLEMEVSAQGQTMTEKVKIESITKEKMVTSDKNGKLEFTRVN